MDGWQLVSYRDNHKSEKRVARQVKIDFSELRKTHQFLKNQRRPGAGWTRESMTWWEPGHAFLASGVFEQELDNLTVSYVLRVFSSPLSCLQVL